MKNEQALKDKLLYVKAESVKTISSTFANGDRISHLEVDGMHIQGLDGSSDGRIGWSDGVNTWVSQPYPLYHKAVGGPQRCGGGHNHIGVILRVRDGGRRHRLCLVYRGAVYYTGGLVKKTGDDILFKNLLWVGGVGPRPVPQS